MASAPSETAKKAPEKKRDVSNEPLAVEVDDLTIAYRAYQQRPTTLKESVLSWIKTRKSRYYSTFDALSGVSFKVHRGEVFGVIGSNGAGKSTLLRAITGVLTPSQGTVTAHGRMDSLIKLGAGFDSELNAVENIYLYFSLYKVPRAQIKERIPRILKFAELEEFAGTPIKYYSSGMSARLGFAVAIERDPDILVVDEVLAVGDERFQKKCRAVFEQYLKDKKTIIIVSHSIGMIEQLCHRVALLSKGKILFVGEPKDAIERYRSEDYQTALSS